MATTQDIINAATAAARQAAPSLVSTVTVQTAFTPPVAIDVNKSLQPGPSNALLKQLKPTFYVSGGIGQTTFAPYGVADPNEWKVKALAAGAVDRKSVV